MALVQPGIPSIEGLTDLSLRVKDGPGQTALFAAERQG